jgi:hypothetical protein
MSEFVCKECGKSFDKRRGFHAHLKAHSISIGEYYVQYYAKRDLYTNELLQFKNYDQYFQEDFNSVENYISWLKTTSPIKAKNHLIGYTRKRFGNKEVRFTPPDLYYMLAQMPNIDHYRRLWRSYLDFSKDLDVESWFTKNLPKNFWEQDCSDIQIFIDTREQKPLKFLNSVDNKLDFGDYTAAGQHYSKTFVDRKARDDFRQTFGKDIERFRREMDRCVQFNSYMFIVVESSIEKIEEDNKISKFKSNLGYLWHNVRSLMIDYPENIQFVFAYSRAGAKKIIPKILYHGQDLWHVDIQYHLEKKVHGMAERKTAVSK